MKILYTSVYRDGTGYAAAAIETILACEAAGLDVVCRPITLSPPAGFDQARRVRHLEAKDLRNVEVVIQHCLPNAFEHKGGVRNVGLFHWETTSFRRAGWAQSCNLMDEVWVSCVQSKHAAIDSGVTVPIRVIPCACDARRFEKPNNPLVIPEAGGRCVFYTIGELSRRKNVVGLIRAYYAAFQRGEDVALVLKLNVPGQGKEAVFDKAQMIINEIRGSLGLHHDPKRYPPVICITDQLSGETLDRLHQLGDVFVLPSRGESWCVPCHDAMGFGNPVIVSNWGSLPELMYPQATRYFDPQRKVFRYPGQIATGWLTHGQLTFAFSRQEGGPTLYSGDESWFEPDLPQLATQLAEAYGEWKDGSLKQRGDAARSRALEFSHEHVGRMIAEALLER